MKNLIAEFRDFVNRGNLLDLAIAVLLATFFAPVVASIVDGVIMNVIAAIFGEPDFSAIRIKIADGDPPTYLEIGTVITAIVNFLVVALVCFVIIKAYNASRRTAEGDPAPTELDLLTEIRDELRIRNG